MTSVLVGSGIWLLVSENSPKWIGWFGILFFGLGYPVGFFHLFDRRPQIIINELGIWDRTTKQDVVNWEMIQNAYISSVGGQKFICLVVDESYKRSVKKGFWNSRLSKANKNLGFQEINLVISQIKIDEQRLVSFINEIAKVDFDNRMDTIKKLGDGWFIR